MKKPRRSFLQTALAGGVYGVSANLTIMRDLFAQTARQPVVVGHQCDITGGLSSWGYWMDKAAKAACDYVNQSGGIGGRPVRYVVEDTESSPPTGARKFRSLVERSRADFVIGATHSGVNLASVPLAKELRTVYIPNGMAEEKTGPKGNRYVFQVGSDTYLQAAAGAEWSNRTLGNEWTFFFADFAWGWSHYNEHTALLKTLGAKVNDPISFPLDAKDLLPYLARVSKTSKQLYPIAFGAQAVAIYTQVKSMGLDKDMRIYSVICTHEAISPKDLGSATEGIYLLEYFPRMLKYKDTPHTRRLRELMNIDPVEGREKGSNRVIAGSHHWAAWESVFFIQKAVEKSGWKSKADNPAFIGALEGMSVEESFEHPQGAKRIRKEDHKAIIDSYISRVENGEIHVKQRITTAEVEKLMPPRVDFTKETL
jgi:branched-chain amino acid transport system substrate-binding protein